MTEPPKPPRLLSLDAFRGATIALMILVNNPGSWAKEAGYEHLRHAAWHGWTATDWVFPFFLFIVGVAIPFALGRRLEDSGKGAAIRKVIWRGSLLWLIGLALACLRWLITEDGLSFAVTEWPWHKLRILGVLPRIGICYALAGLLFLTTRPRTQALLAVGILLAWWPLVAYAPNPDVPTPEGALPMDDQATHLGAWLDQMLLGTDHIWVGSKVYDPEGILSTPTALVTVLLGAFAGRLLRSQRSAPSKALALMLTGAAGIALGLAWDQVLPLNKPLWTSSFTVFTGGCAAVGLGTCYLLFDAIGPRLPALRALARPGVIYGVNALLVFVGSAIGSHMVRKWTRIAVEREGGPTEVNLTTYLYRDVFSDAWELSPKDASLAYAVCWVGAWFVILAVLYRFRIIWKI